MSSFRKHLNSMLEQPDFQEEYEKLQPEFEIMKALVLCQEKVQIKCNQFSPVCG